MTTPTPTPDQWASVPWAVFIPVVVALLGALGVTIRLLFKGVHKRIDSVERTFGERLEASTEANDEKIEEKFQRVHELVIQLDERVGKYFEAHERLRDRWDEFLREYLKIDSTRGQKVDALFRVNDQIQKVVDALPRHVDSKIEEAFTHSLSELKLYVRDLLAKEKSNAK
jgi:hypothetical protein